MKVSGHTPPDLMASKAPSANTANTPKAQADAAQTVPSAANHPGVTMALTGNRRSQEQRALSRVPDVDAQKVASMKVAIVNGTFTVNPEAIAGKLLSNARDMLQATPRQP